VNQVLVWIAGVAVMLGVGLAATYLMLLGVAWLFLRPFVSVLEVLSCGL
jgi:hypothetical protein